MLVCFLIFDPIEIIYVSLLEYVCSYSEFSENLFLFKIWIQKVEWLVWSLLFYDNPSERRVTKI